LPDLIAAVSHRGFNPRPAQSHGIFTETMMIKNLTMFATLATIGIGIAVPSNASTRVLRNPQERANIARSYGARPQDPCTEAFRRRSEGTCRGTWEEAARGDHQIGRRAHERSMTTAGRLARPVGLGAYRRPSIQPKGNKALWIE
jgi:hypothetical protein